MTGLVKSANTALHDLEDPPDHRFVSAHWLGNGGVLLEMHSEVMAGWLSAPAIQSCSSPTSPRMCQLGIGPSHL